MPCRRAPTGPFLWSGPPLRGTGDYDDERLAGLVETASIRLMRLSMEHAHALYLQDADAAAVAADDMHAFSVRLLGEVQPLQVSPPERQPFKDEFVRSLEAYSAASKTLLDPVDTGEDAVRRRSGISPRHRRGGLRMPPGRPPRYSRQTAASPR